MAGRMTSAVERCQVFNPLLRVEFDLMEILAEPWASLGHS